jgi:outer membrane protein OmpA-like peptidoglycan-associated protein
MLLQLLAAAALAQDTTGVTLPQKLNAQTYRTPIDATRTMWADDSAFAGDNYLQARLAFDYSHAPFVFEWADTGEQVGVVSDALAADLIGGYSIKRLRFGLDVPIYLLAAGDLASGAGLGDVAVDLKATALDRNDDAPLGLAFATRLSLPTGTVAVPMGGALAWDIEAIADKTLVDDKLLLVANLGARLGSKPDPVGVAVSNKFVARLGTGYSITENGGVSLDLDALVDLGDAGDNSGSPVELMAGGWGRVSDDFVLRGGVGTGLTAGIGSPQARAVLSIAYEPPTAKDSDLDGLVDSKDACPMDPEDIDQFEDANGCPDPDNDQDGIADATDQCRDVAEDLDSWQDQDGCPDPKTQVTVKIVDQVSGRPVVGVASVVNGTGDVREVGDEDFTVELAAGTYSLSAELAKYKPLKASFDVKDGPPVELRYTIEKDLVPGVIRIRVTDPSGTSITSATWALNDNAAESVKDGQAETSLPPGGYVLMVRADGYAPSSFPATVKEGATSSFNVVLQPSKVKVTKEKLEIKDKIFFDTGKATIQSKSFALLDEIANILLDRPDILMVRIEGHTDNRGDDAANMKLSQARAEAVKKYFTDKGVEASRLNAIGYGETKPVDPANNAAAWDKNRRVEFYIEKWADAPQ